MASVNWSSLYNDFPRLRNSKTFRKTSDATPLDQREPIPYNCAAHALEKNAGWWWPQADALWFHDLSSDGSTGSLIAGFKRYGYSICKNGDLERGVQKIAIYVSAKGPEHIARQLGNGLWSSKIGANIDATHTLEELAGALFGSPAIFMSRLKNRVRRRSLSRRRRRST